MCGIKTTPKLSQRDQLTLIDIFYKFCNHTSLNINKLFGYKAINKILKICAVFSIIGTQTSGANMLPPTFYDFAANSSSLRSDSTSNSNMYLGNWSKQISNKLNPNFYNQLGINTSQTNAYQPFVFSTNISNDYFSLKGYSFSTKVFSNNLFNDSLDENGHYFSFSSGSVQLSSSALRNIVNSVVNNQFSKKKQAHANLIGQEFYTPSYTISRGSTSFGIGAILVQQRFLDDSLSEISFGGLSPYQFYSDNTFSNVNRGTGYQFHVTQKLPASIDIAFSYQSTILMNEFDTLGRSYSDPGDFNIPKRYNLSVELPVFSKNHLKVSAHNVAYSDISPIVHNGYSQNFLNLYNNFFSPIYKLKDLTYYTLSFDQKVNSNLSWKIDVISRQQAPATSRAYNNILNEDTAAVSFKVGVTQLSKYGNFNVFASFANKPILIGSTDFGRLNSNSIATNHLEGVASWSFQF